jgi:hypothetical protein
MLVPLALFALAAGAGLGWITCTVVVVRPLQRTIIDMRYQGFLLDRPVPPSQRVRDVFELANET